MEIPSINISVTKAAVDGKVVDVVELDNYVKNKENYNSRQDIAIPVKFKNKDILLPYRGEYPTTGKPITPGIYSKGPLTFEVDPEPDFFDRYIPQGYVTMTNLSSIQDLIKASEESKKLDEPFITTPDSVTNIPIKDNDQPEMIALKAALNAKHIDIDSYAGRFGDNYPNDKRQLKINTATLKIIKRYCDNCDMEALITFRDKTPDVPNPMGKSITVSLTEPIDDETMYNLINSGSKSLELSSDEDDDFED